jgi:hypothetical protein
MKSCELTKSAIVEEGYDPSDLPMARRQVSLRAFLRAYRKEKVAGFSGLFHGGGGELNHRRDSDLVIEKVFDSAGKSGGCGPPQEEAGLKRAGKDPQLIPKNRTGSGRARNS